MSRLTLSFPEEESKSEQIHYCVIFILLFNLLFMNKYHPLFHFFSNTAINELVIPSCSVSVSAKCLQYFPSSNLYSQRLVPGAHPSLGGTVPSSLAEESLNMDWLNLRNCPWSSGKKTILRQKKMCAQLVITTHLLDYSTHFAGSQSYSISGRW